MEAPRKKIIKKEQKKLKRCTCLAFHFLLDFSLKWGVGAVLCKARIADPPPLLHFFAYLVLR